MSAAGGTAAGVVPRRNGRVTIADTPIVEKTKQPATDGHLPQHFPQRALPVPPPHKPFTPLASPITKVPGLTSNGQGGQQHSLLKMLVDSLFALAEEHGCNSPAFLAGAERMHACILQLAAEHELLLSEGFELLRLVHLLASNLAPIEEVHATLCRLSRRTSQAPSVGEAVPDLGWRLMSEAPMRESSYELALKMYCEDADVLEQMRLNFRSRSAEVLMRIAEAAHDGDFGRVCLEAHSLRGMALYLGNAPIATVALALENEATSASADPHAIEVHLAQLSVEVKVLAPAPAAPTKGGHANESTTLPAERLINTKARRLIGNAIERLTHAAACRDIAGVGAAALALKQMTLCHGPLFDLLGIAAYRLQKAAESGNGDKALAHLPPVVDAAAHTSQLLLLEATHPPLLCSLRKVSGVCFFSHVIGEHQRYAAAAHEGGSAGAVVPAAAGASAAPATSMSNCHVSSASSTPPLLHLPPVDQVAGARRFNGDSVVLARAITAFVTLVPAWLRSAQEAVEGSHLVLLRSEAWVLHTTAGLIGAQRLATLAQGLQLAVDDLEPLEGLQRRLLLIRTEARLVLAYAANPNLPPMAADKADGPGGLTAPRPTGDGGSACGSGMADSVSDGGGRYDGRGSGLAHDAPLAEPSPPPAQCSFSNGRSFCHVGDGHVAGGGDGSGSLGGDSSGGAESERGGARVEQSTAGPMCPQLPMLRGLERALPPSSPSHLPPRAFASPQSVVSAAAQVAQSPAVRLTGGTHGVTARTLQYLVDATYEACDAALGEGGYQSLGLVPEGSELKPQSNDLLVAIETARAAAAMVEGLMAKAAQRCGSILLAQH